MAERVWCVQWRYKNKGQWSSWSFLKYRADRRDAVKYAKERSLDYLNNQYRAWPYIPEPEPEKGGRRG